MTRSRGRPVIPLPVHPERVLSRAVKAGLSATIELQRNIKNKTTQKYYERSRDRFRIRQQVYQITKDRGQPDFSYISHIEGPTRDDMRQMFYEKAAEYGFTEIGRQKNTDDTVDSLNQRFNACGKVIRENSEVMFPHPNPVDFGTYSRRVGKGRKKFRRAGYDGSSFGPKVILAHPDLPSLDFGDAVRSHNEYLATFCAIHDVPVRDTTRYSQLLFLLVRPYLEYLYSEFKYGKSNFQKGVNWALRQVKNLILEAGYRPTMYEKRTVTRELEFDQAKNKEENQSFFKKHEDEAREIYGDHPAVTELIRLRGTLGDKKKKKSMEDDDTIFTAKDVEHIRKKASKRARVAGSIMHRRIAELFPSPWRLNDVIYSGDRYTHSTDYIIIAEVPLQTTHGAGKVDLILCERTISDDGKRVFWKPVFILEIKTRLGQIWYINAKYKKSEVRPEKSSFQRIVSDFPLSSYPLSDDLWDAIVKSTPSRTARKQLNIYSQALTESYENLTEQKLGHILRGVVIIDASSDIADARSVLEQLIVHAYKSVRDRTRQLRRTVFTPRDHCRITLVLDKQPGPQRKEERVTRIPWVPRYSPFKTKIETKRRFLLYLAGHSPTSAGQSAAWNARYFHGLQMLYEMWKTQKNTEFIWIDLANQFIKPRLAEARLRLRPRSYLEEERVKVQPDHIREFFDSINVNGCLDDILSFLHSNGNFPKFELKSKKNKRKVVIVTGADTLRDATPTSSRNRFTALIDHLLSSLPDDEKSTIVWFDSPVPSVEKAIPYSSRALLPFYEISSLGEVVTEVVWNLPIAPKDAVQPDKWGLPIIGNSPMHDDIRVIVHHTPADFHTELIHVPLLRGWSKRFRNKGTGQVIHEREIDDIVPDRSVRNRMKLLSLTMLPWLIRLWPQEKLVEDSTENLEALVAQLEMEFRGESKPKGITKEVMTEGPISPPSLLDLVKFRLPQTMDGLSYQRMTSGKINSQRLYRAQRKLQNKPLQEVPAQRVTEDVLPTKEELEREWLFGVKFESEDDDIQSWWMVIQDTSRPSRMLVGCFVDRPPDKDGFLWAESKQEILMQFSLDEILSFPQTILIGRKKEDGLELWSSAEGEEAVYAGNLEVKGQGRTTRGHLRAIKQTFAEELRGGPSFTTRPSESFYGRMVDSLRSHLAVVTNPTPVTLYLEMVDDVCHLVMKDDEGEKIQAVTISYTADLIAFLRRRITNGEPMFTDSGVYVTWSIFDDIEYGKMDFIRPYVTYTAARKTPVELPKRVSQFFDEAKSLTVSIEHDTSICPLALEVGVDHGACWRIKLPRNCPDHVRRQLRRPLTGEEVNGLLAPGKFYAERLYNFDFTLPRVSEMDESIVFHEERYIRMFLRSKKLPLKKLLPGTFLRVTGQQWVVSIGWEDRYFEWSARSLISGLSFRGKQQKIELTHGLGAEEECNRLMKIITSQIPAEQIQEHTSVIDQVLIELENRGYSEKSPECELKTISQSESHFVFGVFLSTGSQNQPLRQYSIGTDEPVNTDAIIERLSLDLTEGELRSFNIVGESMFLTELATWLSEHAQYVDEGDETMEKWTVNLSVDIEREVIEWNARQGLSDPTKSGVMSVASREFRQLGQKVSCKEVRNLFEIEVIPKLEEISNLEEVFEEQIPDVVRKLLLNNYS